DLVKAMGMSGISKSQVSRLCEEIDGKVKAFLEISSAVAGAAIEIVNVDRLKEMNVVNGGNSDVSLSVQARNKMLYVLGERDSLYGHHKVLFCYIKGTGFVFFGLIEAQGREAELMQFEAVELVVNGEKLAIDISDRAMRFVSGRYVAINCRLSHEEARLIAYSDSFGVMVRASREAPVFLGIFAMSTEGGREQLETFFGALSVEQ
ncbi:UNVERIFIED_ORG: hypothetical protein J2W85_006107, partial [Ensifer adhaerens]|nr:hypothetical protein [Ensifer adhaerens]